MDIQNRRKWMGQAERKIATYASPTTIYTRDFQSISTTAYWNILSVPRNRSVKYVLSKIQNCAILKMKQKLKRRDSPPFLAFL